MAYADVYKKSGVGGTGHGRDAFIRDKPSSHERPVILDKPDPPPNNDKEDRDMSASFKLLAIMAGLLLIAVIGCIVLGVILYKQGYGSQVLREVNGSAHAYGYSAQVGGQCPPCRLDDLVWSVQCPPCGSEMSGCPPCKPWMEKIVCPKCAREADDDNRGQCEPCTSAVRDCPPCSDRGACVTPQCLKDAAKIKEAMDETVDPCDNFFDFACGNWLKANPPPHGVDKWETTMSLERTTMNRARRLIQSPVKRANESSAERKMKDYDASCTAGKMSEREEKAGLKRVIYKIGGYAGYPEHLSKLSCYFFSNFLVKMNP